MNKYFRNILPLVTMAGVWALNVVSDSVIFSNVVVVNSPFSSER